MRARALIMGLGWAGISLLGGVARSGGTQLRDATSRQAPLPPPAPVASDARAIDQLLRADYPANAPGAAVLVAQHGRVLLRSGYGLADLAAGVPMTADREFRVASISKQFTAVAVLQLAAEGRIALDDPVARYLPDLFGGRDWGITVRQLLAHTSGLKNYSDIDAFRDQPTRPMSTAFLWSLVKGYGTGFPPGTRWEYCNTGYMLLGAMVERVAGMPFGEYLRRNVLAPAGLGRTRYGAERDDETADARAAADGVTGYARVDEGPGAAYEAAVVLNLSQANAAGALITCVDDLWRWEQAVEKGAVLPQSWVSLARSPASLTAPRQQLAKSKAASAARRSFGDGAARAPYGLGWEIGASAGLETIGHGGTMCGYRSYEVEVPAAELYIVILCNCDHPDHDPADVADEIIARMAR